jgi:fatty acid desaturase
MTEVTINCKSSQWTDWFFGGLHFHIEHHVWPKIPRYNLRVINYDMKKFMKEFDILYEYKWLWVAFGEMNAHLKRIGKVWIADYNKTKKIKEQ